MAAPGWWTFAAVAGLYAVAAPVLFHWDWLFPQHAEEMEWTNFTEWALNQAWRGEPFAHLPYTPLLTCEPVAPTLLQRFDWTIGANSAWRDVTADFWNATGEPFECCSSLDGLPLQEKTQVSNPKTVWAAPHAVQRLLELCAERLDSKRPDRTVVFSGSEYPLSRAFGSNDSEREATVAALKKYFKRIVYQTKDIMLEGVHLAPMGLSFGYTMGQLKEWVEEIDRVPMEQRFMDFGQLLRGNISSKTKNVLATAGVVAGWLVNETTMEWVKFFAYFNALMPPSNSSLRAVATAFESRKRLQHWLGMGENDTEVRSPAALAAGVEFASVSMTAWWYELAKYRFLLAPTGSNIQVAKNIEALLVLTVPVVMRLGWELLDELQRMGFPLVLVRGWMEVTKQATSLWWQRLSPRLQSFRDNCLTTEGYWRLYTGQLTMCV